MPKFGGLRITCLPSAAMGSSANNHVIAEAAGQLVGALAFDWFAESDRWREEATCVIERELRNNTFPSGVNREMAFDYHGFVTELAVVAAAEANWAGRPLSPELWASLYRMFDVGCLATVDVQKVRAPRRERWGQWDGAPSSTLPPPNGGQTLLAIGEALFDAPAWWPTVEPTATSTVLASMAGRHTSARSGHRPSHYADAGMTLLRSSPSDGKEIWCRCDAGRHGFLSIAAHAHADALSVEVRHDGVDVLADPGTYCYHGEPSWRRYFRSTLAHNTIEVGGQDQSGSGGPFLWTRHAQSTPWSDWRGTKRGGHHRVVRRARRLSGGPQSSGPPPQVGSIGQPSSATGDRRLPRDDRRSRNPARISPGPRHRCPHGRTECGPLLGPRNYHANCRALHTQRTLVVAYERSDRPGPRVVFRAFWGEAAGLDCYRRGIMCSGTRFGLLHDGAPVRWLSWVPVLQSPSTAVLPSRIRVSGPSPGLL